MRLLSFLVVIALSGCVQAEDGQEIPTQETEVVIDPVHCEGAFAIRTPEFSELDRWLPPGFHAADASVVLSDALLPTPDTERGMMGAFVSTCLGKADYGMVDFWILVEPPKLEGVELTETNLHWFEVAAYFQDLPGQEVLFALDMNMYPMELDFLDVSTDVFTGRQFLATTEELVFQVVNFGTVPILGLSGPTVIWQVNQNGTLIFDATLDLDAASGYGSCDSDLEWVRDFMNSCDRTNLLLYGTIENMQLAGTFRYFEGILPR